MTDMTVRFEPDEEAWVFSSGDLDPGVPVAVVIGGLRWVVSNLACATPWRVEVDADASSWAREAVATLLGPAAAEVLDGPTDQVHGDITLELESAARRAAMGMLAVAAAQPASSALRPIDMAALTHRAGLDSLPSPLPGADRLVDDAVEALDLLPPAVIDALAGEDPPNRGAGWGIAREGFADAGRFLYRVTGELPAHVDVDATFDDLTRNLGSELLAAAAEPGSGDLAFLGGPRSIESLVVDTTIRGVIGVIAVYDPDSAQVSVTLTARVLALSSKAERLLVRVIAEETGAIVGHVALGPDPAPRAGTSLVARFTVPEGVVPSRVEVVRDEGQPALDLVAAREFHRTYELLEGQRVLGQAGAYVGDIRASSKAFKEHIAAAMVRGPLADLASGFELDVFPLPSDGLVALLGEVADQIVAGLESLAGPAERAAMAHNTGLLAGWAVVPWVMELGGDAYMIEARAGAELGQGSSPRYLLAARRAAAAYNAASKHDKAAAAQAFLAEHGGETS